MVTSQISEGRCSIGRKGNTKERTDLQVPRLKIVVLLGSVEVARGFGSVFFPKVVKFLAGNAVMHVGCGSDFAGQFGMKTQRTDAWRILKTHAAIAEGFIFDG